MNLMKRCVSLILAMTLGLSTMAPTAVLAQDNATGGGGYGQALGGRRTQTRPVNPTINTGSQQDTQAEAYDTGQRGGGRMGSYGTTDINAYQIHILGQVRHPGTYRLPPSIRMAEAIDIAGGIASKGSFRRIELKRNNRTVRTYDLSSFLYGGRLDQNPFLLDNDEVYVPIAKKVISVQGPVNRTGVIEIVNEDSLYDIVQLAGGYTVGVLTSEPATVIRYRNGKKEILHVDLSEDSVQNFHVEDGDIIVFPHQLTQGRKFDYNIAQLPNDTLFYPSFNDNIFVMGAVAQPGAYPFNPFYDPRHYINMAGAVRYANLKRIKILDMNGKSIKYTEGYRMSPGDTIVVPYRAWTTDNILKWYNTISSTIFTGFALQQLIKQQ